MRVVICEEAGSIEIRERPRPSVDVDKVLVRVTVCGVCASDVAVWRGCGTAGYPYLPGHEFCGTVEEAGAHASHLRVGDRVVINPNLGCGACRYCRAGQPNLCDHLKSRPIKSNGGLADFVALDARMVRRIPEALPDDLATFVEPLSCALHAVRKARVLPGERVGVFGAGAVGILTGIALDAISCDALFVEPDANRRSRVRDLFESPAVDPEGLRESAWCGALDAAIICCESPKAVEQAAAALRKAGRLILLGVVTRALGAAAPLKQITTKEARVEGAWLNPHTFDEALGKAVACRRTLSSLTTRTFPLDRVREAFETAATRAVHRVLVRP